MTHDPPFVKRANKDIPLIQSIEHPITEAIEFMATVEQFGKLEAGHDVIDTQAGYWSLWNQSWARQENENISKDAAAKVPEFVIIEP